jgi:hypothetical protein
MRTAAAIRAEAAAGSERMIISGFDVRKQFFGHCLIVAQADSPVSDCR